MKALLLMIGTELLNGGMVDTNSLYMAEELNKFGIEIESKLVVRDFMDEIVKAINYAKENADLVICSGGLGPTIDDITKEAIAKVLGKKLIIDEQDRVELERKFQKVGIPFTGKNLREIEEPEGALSFKNDAGMAPGIFIDGISAFPGVPVELYNLFPKFLKWYSKEVMKEVDEIYIKDLITVGIPESILEEKIKHLFIDDEIYYEFLVKEYGILVRLQSKLSNKNSVEKIVKKIYNVVGYSIYGEDDDRLETLIYETLLKEKKMISLAESCTGGLIASKLIGVAGSSSVVYEGLVTYSNESKVKRLSVSEDTLSKFGAVSKEVAREMLEGLKTEVGISITGIAGPTGGSDEKPVGLVYIGIKVDDNYLVQKYRFRGNRNKVRERACNQALFDCLNALRGENRL